MENYFKGEGGMMNKNYGYYNQPWKKSEIAIIVIAGVWTLGFTCLLILGAMDAVQAVRVWL